MKKINIFITIVLLLLFSCKKPTSKVDILTTYDWVITGYTANPGIDYGSGTIITDLFSILDNCTKTSTYKYNTDGKRLTTNGCNSEAVTTDSWAFVNNETALDITTAFSRDTVEIIELTNERMILESKIEEQTYTITYEPN